MAEREMTLTASESVTKIGVVENFDKVILTDMHLQYGNQYMYATYCVCNRDAEGNISGIYRQDNYTVRSSGFLHVVDGQTDAGMQDRIFNNLVSGLLVGSGTLANV